MGQGGRGRRLRPYRSRQVWRTVLRNLQILAIGASAVVQPQRWRLTARVPARRAMNSFINGRKNALLKRPSGGSG